MRVILLTDVKKVGRKGEVVEAADGYAQNFLIARGLARPATKEALAAHEAKLARVADEKKFKSDLARQTLKGLDGARVDIKAKANEKGHLFKSIGREDIARAIEAQRAVRLSPEDVVLAAPLKETGEHHVSLASAGAHAKLLVIITSA
jgi:large subunit ribosomal protein L9